jgi:HK97 family phage major capsid protein
MKNADYAIKAAQNEVSEKFYEWCFSGYEEDKRSYIKARTQQIGGKHLYGGYYKSLNVGTDTGAGFALAPPELINGIIAAQKNDLIMRQLATVRQSNSIQGTGITTMTTDFTGASWVGEETTVTTDQPVVGKRELVPKYMRSEYIESDVFLEWAPADFQTWLQDRYAYSFNNIEDQAFISGNGVAKPVGLFEAAAQGAIPTSRDKTASFTTSVTLADVKALYYNLKPQYRRDPTCRWVMNRAAVSLVDGITDDNGRPIWNQANIVAGTPETLYGIQIMESENAPSAMTTGTYWSFLGAMRNYWIVDFMGFRVKRLNETHALTMQTGFVGFKAVDGQWMLAEAATRGILA